MSAIFFNLLVSIFRLARYINLVYLYLGTARGSTEIVYLKRALAIVRLR